LWGDDRGPYLLPDILADIGGGDNVRAAVFIECRAMYRAGGPEAMRPLGEKVQDVLETQLALTGGRTRGIRWSIPHDTSGVGKYVSRFVAAGFPGMPHGAPGLLAWPSWG